jgi:hypothetical protein
MSPPTPSYGRDCPSFQIALVGQIEFELYVEKIYATDRHGNSKGMVEVIL